MIQNIQDTFVALKALREYGEHLSNRDIFGMQVHLEATSTVNNQDLWDRVVNLPRGDFSKYVEFQVILTTNMLSCTDDLLIIG